MGLDISAYKNLTKIEGVKYLEGKVYGRDLKELDYDDYDLVAYANSDFPGREEGIENRGVYKAEDSYGFRAGSYGGYNSWRDNLAKFAGYPLSSYGQYGKEWPSYAASAWEAGEGPFYELVHFSDCEGIIGTAVSKKLLKDFRDFANKLSSEDDHFQKLYHEWWNAFEMAAQNGAVSFH